MDISEIEREWDKDCLIDSRNLLNESTKVPQLHHKYYKFYLKECSVLREMENRFKRFESIKYNYYQGRLHKDDLDKFGWPQFELKLLKSDIQRTIESDDDLVKLKDVISEQKEKIEYIRAILDNISKRSFLIGHAIESQKLEIGLA